MEITVKDLWKVLKKSIVLVILGAILCGAALYVYVDKTAVRQYRSSAEYYLKALLPATTSADMNNNLVVGAKYIPTMGDYLMTEETMELVLKVADEWAEKPQDGADPEQWREEWTLENSYSAKSLLGKFSFISPAEDEVKLTFTVRCTTLSAKDSRILLNAFGWIINERCKVNVLNSAYEVQTIEEPQEGRMLAVDAKSKGLLGAAVGA